jgi:hypothetical protein
VRSDFTEHRFAAVVKKEAGRDVRGLLLLFGFSGGSGSLK